MNRVEYPTAGLVVQGEEWSGEGQRMSESVNLERYGQRATKKPRLAKKACTICQRMFSPERPEQRMCSRLCANKHTSNTRKGKRVPRKHRPEYGPQVEPLGVPHCPSCAQQLGKYNLGSDPMTGASTIWCPTCGEQPLPRYGMRQYDQRERSLAEMETKVRTAQRSLT